MEKTVEERIIEVLDKIRPYIRNEGGDILFQRFENGVVYVKMVGACQECPLVDVTLEDVALEALSNEVPEVIKVISE